MIKVRILSLGVVVFCITASLQLHAAGEEANTDNEPNIYTATRSSLKHHTGGGEIDATTGNWVRPSYKKAAPLPEPKPAPEQPEQIDYLKSALSGMKKQLESTMAADGTSLEQIAYAVNTMLQPILAGPDEAIDDLEKTFNLHYHKHGSDDVDDINQKAYDSVRYAKAVSKSLQGLERSAPEAYEFYLGPKSTLADKVNERAGLVKKFLYALATKLNHRLAKVQAKAPAPQPEKEPERELAPERASEQVQAPDEQHETTAVQK